MTLLLRPGPQGFCYDPAEACRHLTDADTVLGRLIDRVGPFGMRVESKQSLFAALFRAIAYQQLSGKAAETILGRVCALFAPKRFPTPRDIVDIAPERLRAAGLSNAKVAAVRDLAARTLAGEVPAMAVVRRMSDDEIVEQLTAIRGIGRWTAEMLLIFHLGRPDVLPVADLGVRKGFARAFRSRSPLAATTIVRRAERWRPYRSVATWYLWRALDT
jgi:3-methyladenine DNA glycosylase/8-oxoguanine DNA glycosylase